MGVEIAINVTKEETRVAVLDNKSLTDVFVDRAKKKDFVGDIYKGKVIKVLPGMQAAFVDIALDRAAFMHVSDLSVGIEPGETLMDSEEEEEKEPEIPRPRRQTARPIEQLLEEGQELVVQVAKGAIGSKGSRVTTYCSLPGRFLVLMPNVDHIGVSRRIANDEERVRLKEVMRKIRKAGYGYIVRTVCEGVHQEDLRSDVEFLNALWQDILIKRDQSSAPARLHSELTLPLRIVRDLFSKHVDRLLIDSQQEYEEVKEFVRRYLPGQTSKVQHYDKPEGLFDYLGIESDITRALNRKVWLRSGGHIVIDHTEAMTVIDVNTGRYVGKRDQEETILKNNLEAVKEIAYQIKLRGIGGIIVIDFIDMERERNREKVYKALVDAMAKDKAQTKISRISELGLVEISRERVREDLLRTLSNLCDHCDGRGYTKSAMTVAYDIFRDIRRIGMAAGQQKLVIGVHPQVVELLSESEHGEIEQLEQEFDLDIEVHTDPLLHLEQYDMIVMTGKEERTVARGRS